MCFAWCNADMLDSAPTRNVEIGAPHSHSTAKILQSLVIFPLIKKSIRRRPDVVIREVGRLGGVAWNKPN